MNKREKILAISLGSTLLLFVVVPTIWGYFRKPLTQLEKELGAVERLRDTQDQDLTRNLSTLTRMKDYKARSLSSNASQGALSYQQWLSDLAEVVAKFSKPLVTPERILAAKDNTYVLVRVRVTGEASIEQVRQFLFRFHRANLMHHITNLTVEAMDNSLNPRLKVNIMAEAMSLRDAPKNDYLSVFPRTTLNADIAADAKEIRVASAKDFPDKAPFEVRIADQYVMVTKTENTVWTIQPAPKQKLTAKTGATVELSPTNAEFAGKTPEDFEKLILQNPFAKPIPYRPKLELVGDKTVQRGSSVTLEPKATGFDSRTGAPTYKVVGELSPGMKFDDGKLVWTPPSEAKAGTFKVAFQATAPGLKAPLDGSFELTLKDLNTPPKVDMPKDLVATIGQPITVKLTATDTDTPADQLKYKLNDPKPEGVTLNESTGEITWTPAATLPPGAVTISVAVTDNGTPPQSTTVSVPITVQDDSAQFTFLTASVAADSEMQAWLYDRSKNARLILKEGKPLQYAGFNATVTKIGRDYVQFTQQDKTWRITVGQNLREAKVDATAAPLPPPQPENR